MAPTFSVIEWLAAPDLDMHCVRFGAGGAAAPVRLDESARLRGESFVLSFRPASLTGPWRAAWRALDEEGRALDATLLARIVAPTLEGHTFSHLARRQGILQDPGDGREAAALAGAVMTRLLRKLMELPLAILAKMDDLLKPTHSSLRAVIGPATKAALKSGFGKTGRDMAEVLPGELGGRDLKRPEPPAEPPLPIDGDRLAALFRVDGPIASAREGYEHRREQVRMAREVADAFNEAVLLMVEAGTGTGKSLAYLAPAVAWAVQNEEPVVVATRTKNLQSQLVAKDLPLLAEAMGKGFRYALIKGRSNYLCLRKFLLLLREADRELSEQDRIDILPVLAWLPKADLGDPAENVGFRAGTDAPLWGLMSTRADECVGRNCRHFGRCFVRRARARAAQCDVIVANHATVFHDLGAPGPVLPEHRCIIFDEAHNLEDVAAGCFAAEVAPWRVPRILNRLYRRGRRGAGRGLFTSLRFELNKSEAALDDASLATIRGAIEEAIGFFPKVQGAGEAAFAAVDGLFARARRTDRLRYDADRRPEGWPRVAQAMSDYAEVLGEIAQRTDRIAVEIETGLDANPRGNAVRDLLEVAAEIGMQGPLLRAVMEDVQLLLKAEDESRVYWAERGGAGRSGSLSAAPLDIADLMNEFVYARKRSVVMTSATLTAAGSFDFMRDRLGLRGPAAERTRTVDLGSSYDFETQAFAGVPVFLPAPRAYGPDFVTPFSDLAADILRATRGRGLVLFTSHAMLRRADALLRSALAAEGIRVLAQGIDGAREHIMAEFTRDTSSVLLGTQSFWEGVDIPGESLSCLILAKLPFRPHTDPIVSARCDRLKALGHNDFAEYMLPDAVIRLKQGFGRLIRSRRDRGVVVLCDARAVTKSYGRAFRVSLPTPVRVFRDAEALLRGLSDFLASD
jgi:ATP-dependent DNA helicase DinG